MKPHCTLMEEETLAELVRQYPCLYDKSDKGYKEKDRKKNAWKEIEDQVLLRQQPLFNFRFLIILK